MNESNTELAVKVIRLSDGVTTALPIKYITKIARGEINQELAVKLFTPWGAFTLADEIPAHDVQLAVDVLQSIIQPPELSFMVWVDHKQGFQTLGD